MGYSPWGYKESDVTEDEQFHFQWLILCVNMPGLWCSIVWSNPSLYLSVSFSFNVINT